LINGLAGGIWERHVRNKPFCISVCGLVTAECNLLHLFVVLQMVIYALLWTRARHFYNFVNEVLYFYHIFLYFIRVEHQRNRFNLDEEFVVDAITDNYQMKYMDCFQLHNLAQFQFMRFKGSANRLHFFN
jgi:hypothetical protein